MRLHLYRTYQPKPFFIDTFSWKWRLLSPMIYESDDTIFVVVQWMKTT